MKHLLHSLALRVTMLIALLVSFGSSGAWATTTYKLTKVTSVSAGNKYVFEQNSRVLNNTVSSSALRTTGTYYKSGLAGTESYIWELESATGGFYLKNVSLNSNQYLNNSSGTGVSFGSKTSIWTIAFTDDVALISNKSNSNRFLGDAGGASPNNTYKAYATSNLSTYPHDFTVYLVEEEVAVSKYAITKSSTNGSISTKVSSIEVSEAAEDATVTIEATPNSGYSFSSWSVTKTVGGAAVSVVNSSVTPTTFTMPAEAVTVTANFAALPTHTVTFSVNGNTSLTVDVYEGGNITFPNAVETPGEGEFSKVVNGKTFVGWCTTEYSHATDAPTYVNTTTATMSTSDVTYYAVYADVEEEESNNIADAVKSQTLSYDTWTYSGSTTDKSSNNYRLFHKDSYIESETFDLSKLIKVVVKGGTFGGSEYNSLTIGDGTSTWKNVTVSGSSETGTNTYTGGSALSGTNKLRITCNSGTASGSGVRISSVEIYVKGTIINRRNFTTDVRSVAPISYENTSVDVKLSSGYTGQALTNPNTLSVSYSSSDETVATVNSSTGVITELLKAGTTTITASFAGNSTYKPAEVSYDINVTEKTPHGLAYATDEVAKLTTDATFTNTLTNGHSLTVSYSSSATGVATVNSSTGEVTIKGAGSTTITATFAGNDDYESGSASYTLTVSKATPILAYAEANATLRQGKDFEGNALTNPANLTVSYSSSTTSVATVNSSTGVPTFVAAGSTTITASFAGNDTYSSAEATYTLKVLAAPTISLSDDYVDWGETYTFDASGLSSYGDVTLTSGNTSIATVAGLVITPAAVGEVTITVSTAENETYDAGSNTFTLTINAPEGSDEAPSGDILLFGESFGNNTGSARVWNNSYSVKSGVSAVYSGITGYTVSNAKQSINTGGSTLSGLIGMTGTDAYIIIGPLNVANYSNMTLKYKWKAASISKTYSTSAYYKTSADGEFTEITGGTGAGATTFVDRSYTVPAAAQVSTLYLKIVWNTSNTQGYIDEVQLTTPAVTSKDVTLNKYGYATFCSDKPMDFTSTTGYTAWRVNSIDVEETTGTITYKKITEAIKGGQGVLLFNKDADGENTSDVTINFADGSTVFDDGSDSDDTNDNLLVGTIAPTYITGTVYGLSGNKFVKNNAAGIINSGKAYLPVGSIPSGVKSFTFVFEDTTTGVTETRTATREEVEAIFNLNGQRMSKMQRGINIVKGKKVLVK